MLQPSLYLPLKVWKLQVLSFNGEESASGSLTCFNVHIPICFKKQNIFLDNTVTQKKECV